MKRYFNLLCRPVYLVAFILAGLCISFVKDGDKLIVGATCYFMVIMGFLYDCLHPKPLQVWIVGRYFGEGPDGCGAYEIMGVFDSKENAIAACSQYNDFVGPIFYNKKMSNERVQWPGCFYPLAEKPIPSIKKYQS